MTRLEAITRMCEIAAGLKDLENHALQLGNELNEVTQGLLVEEAETEMDDIYSMSDGGSIVFRHYFHGFNPTPDKHLFLVTIERNGTEIPYSFFKSGGIWYLYDHSEDHRYTMLEWVAKTEKVSLGKARALVCEMLKHNESEWPTIELLLTHVFGDKETGVRYVRQLYLNPTQPQPLLFLYSNGMAGKTSFLSLLKHIFDSDMLMLNPISFYGAKKTPELKPIIGIDDALSRSAVPILKFIKEARKSQNGSTVIVTTSDESLFDGKWLKDIPYQSVRVPDFDRSNVAFNKQREKEIPAFRAYLKATASEES